MALFVDFNRKNSSEVEGVVCFKVVKWPMGEEAGGRERSIRQFPLAKAFYT